MRRTFFSLLIFASLISFWGCTGSHNPGQESSGGGLDGEFVMGRKDKGIVLTYENAGIRCSFTELSPNSIFRTECNAVVRSSAGEIPAGSIEAGLSLSWTLPKLVLEPEHFSVSDCLPSPDQLSFSCLVQRIEVGGSLQMDFLLRLKKAVEENTLERTAADSLLLPFSVETLGIIPDLPIVDVVKKLVYDDASGSEMDINAGRGAVGRSAPGGYEKNILALSEMELPIDQFSPSMIYRICNHAGKTYVLSNGRLVALGETTYRFIAGNRGGAANGDTTSPRSIYFDNNSYLSCGKSGIIVSSPVANRMVQVSTSGEIKILLRSGEKNTGYDGDGGPSTQSKNKRPAGVVQDKEGNIYFADERNHVIRKIDTVGIITTFAGGGTVRAMPGLGSREIAMTQPRDLTLRDEPSGGFSIFSVEPARKRFLQITSEGIVRAVYDAWPNPNPKPEGYFGNIPFPSGSPTPLPNPANLVSYSDGLNDWLYYTELNERKIYRLNLATGARTHIAGNGGATYNGDGAGTSHAIGPDAALYNAGEGKFYLVTPQLGRIREMQADGSFTTKWVKKIEPKLFELNAKETMFGDSYGIALTGTGTLTTTEVTTMIRQIDVDGNQKIIYASPNPSPAATSIVEISLNDARFNFPVGIVKHPTANVYYIAEASGNQIRALDLDRSVVFPVAGNGNQGAGSDGVPGISSSLFLRLPSVSAANPPFPRQIGMVFLRDGSFVFADPGNHRIRKVSPDGVISTLIGTGAQTSSSDGLALLDTSVNTPVGVAVDAAGNILFSEYYGRKIRRISTQGTVSTIYDANAYSQSHPELTANDLPVNNPGAMALMPNGDLLVISTPSRLAQLRPGDSGDFSTLSSVQILFAPSDRGECAGGIRNGTAIQSDSDEMIKTSLQTICAAEMTAIAASPTCDPVTHQMSFVVAQRFLTNVGGTGLVKVSKGCQ